ncbi:MAG: hypothetical protein FIB07_02375 [Candidatus Methanoperedens sp.]|nr:hypothetical protein [Candidatus Methanoperedens sp.]
MLKSIKAGKKLRKISVVSVFLMMLTTQVALASYDTKYNDEFNTGMLDTMRWHWIRESPSNWSMTGTSFQMNVTNGTNIDDATAPLLLQDITDNNLSIITKLSAIPTTNYEGGGLIFYSDDNNFVDFEYYTANGFKYLILKKEENNIPAYNTPVKITSYPIYLMLNKTGTSYTAF